MLSRYHVLKALAQKAGALSAYDRQASDALQSYRGMLRHYERLGGEQVHRALSSLERPGAWPTLERQAGRPVRQAFPHTWADHQQARGWAHDRLLGVTTMAVDGSQITPDAAFSIPLGAIQIGWFENPHSASGAYVKDILFELLTPIDLGALGGVGYGYSELGVDLLRFERECAQLQELMYRAADRGERAMALLDGSLITSFASRVRDDLRGRYASAAQAVLRCSRDTGIPVVGYVDSSEARDLTNLLRHLAGLADEPEISDARLLAGELRWGERSEWWICARDDALADEPGLTDHYGEVCFCYLRTTALLPPARVELPRWLVEQGKADETLDLLRAECVVGLGYPYAIETADALAVITVQDRERFYRMVQEHLAEQGLTLRYARKAASKRVRR